MTVEYKNLNSIRLAQPPHHARARLNAIVLPEVDGYPVASTTNQRRRQAHHDKNNPIVGNGKPQKPIKRKVITPTVPKEVGNSAGKTDRPIDFQPVNVTTWEPVGIWRGVDKEVVRGLNSRYNGTALRAIRAKNGVGRSIKKEANAAS